MHHFTNQYFTPSPSHYRPFQRAVRLQKLKQIRFLSKAFNHHHHDSSSTYAYASQKHSKLFFWLFFKEKVTKESLRQVIRHTPGEKLSHDFSRKNDDSSRRTPPNRKVVWWWWCLVMSMYVCTFTPPLHPPSTTPQAMSRAIYVLMWRRQTKLLWWLSVPAKKSI